MMRARALALLLALAPQAAAAVEVRILGRHTPQWIAIEGPQQVLVHASNERLSVDGQLLPALALPAGRWRVRGEGFVRTYEGALQLRAHDGRLAVTLDQPLESYVASVVSAESEPDTPAAALEALAIVARSYALAATDRHDHGALCDLAHCQIAAGASSAQAIAAARATAGLVLRLAGGAIAQAPFHASCGGHTADPQEIFGGADRTGAASRADPGCSAPWQFALPRDAVATALADLLGPHARIASLRLEHGSGGFVGSVVDLRTGSRASGEAFARALDRTAGWGEVRSPRFVLTPGDPVWLRGSGHGHGVGLCQAGAARRARAGASAAEILAHYFPHARVGSL